MLVVWCLSIKLGMIFAQQFQGSWKLYISSCAGEVFNFTKVPHITMQCRVNPIYCSNEISTRNQSFCITKSGNHGSRGLTRHLGRRNRSYLILKNEFHTYKPHVNPELFESLNNHPEDIVAPGKM